MHVCRPSLDRAWTDRVDPDVVRREIHRQATRQLCYCALGRVVRNELRLRDERTHRRDIHHGTTSGRAKQRQHFAHAVRITDHVHAKNAPPIVHRHVLNLPEHERRRVVDQDVYRPKLRLRALNHPSHRSRIRSVRLTEQGPTDTVGVYRISRRFAVIRLQLRDNHVRTLPGEPSTNRLAYPSAATCDDRSLTF